MKVFLGGTCNDSRWRDRLIPLLTIDYFNPVVADWTPECQAREILEREEADYVLYTITPQMIGVYSIAEVVDDSNKQPHRTVFCVLVQDGDKTFSEAQVKSLHAVGAMVIRNGGAWVNSVEAVAAYLNAAMPKEEAA